MEAKAIVRQLRVGPRKARLVVNMVRGKKVQEALDILKFARKATALDVSKLIRSALANAMQKGGVRADSLYVKSIFVDQAGIMKRIMPRARGSASTIQKKLSHITVVLGEKLTKSN